MIAPWAGSWWGDVTLASVGPTISVLFGSLLVGLLLARRNRQAEERARRELRAGLVAEMARVASTLDLSLKLYLRESKHAGRASGATLRTRLDEAYLAARADGDALQVRLEVYYDPGDDDPVELWHAVMDCLTVQYFAAIGRATDELLRENARTEDAQHSGLTARELRDPVLVAAQYKKMVNDAAAAVEYRDFRRRRSASRRRAS